MKMYQRIAALCDLMNQHDQIKLICLGMVYKFQSTTWRIALSDRSIEVKLEDIEIERLRLERELIRVLATVQAVPEELLLVDAPAEKTSPSDTSSHHTPPAEDAAKVCTPVAAATGVQTKTGNGRSPTAETHDSISRLYGEVRGEHACPKCAGMMMHSRLKGWICTHCH